MPESASERTPHEQQLDALIAEYLQAGDEGRPLDQAEFLSLHPEFAAELREFFADDVQIKKFALPPSPVPEETQPVPGSLLPSRVPGRKVPYFGDYELLEELGVGGMGVVYKARQTKLNKIIALKMIKVGHLAGDDEVRRFQAEARAAAKLDHPGIVPVHEVGIDHGQHYYTMDYVGGGSLSKLHREEPAAARRAAEIIKQMAEAMHYAHGQGIVHRDLKPANVLLTPGGIPRITDFGLAKRLWSDDDSADVAMTQTGQIMGTAGYMSPEQAAGKTRLVGPPADIYALGAVLYALLTTSAPFVGESQAEIILQVIQKEPVSPRVLNPNIARDLETICLKCLEKEPHKRYGTAGELADDLARFLENKPVLARPVSTVERTWRWCRRNPWAATALSLVLLVAVVSPLVAIQLYRLAADRERARSETADKAAKLETSLVAERKSKSQASAALVEERKAKSQASAALDESRWQVYRLRLMQMEQLWLEKDWGNLERLLAESVPTAGEKDLRGWEWHYLQGQLERRAWRMYESPEEFVALDWDRHKDKLAVFRAGAVDIWLPRERRLLKSFEVSGAPNSSGLVRWSPDSRHLAIYGGALNVQVVDAETGQIFCTMSDSNLSPKDHYISYVDWSPLGDHVAVTIAGRSIQLWKFAKDPVLIKSLESNDGEASQFIHWSSDQAKCTTISNGGWLMYWNTADWTLLQKKQLVIDQWCDDVAWSPDGKRVAFGKRIGVVANADGTKTKPLADQGSAISSFCWLDNERLANANDAQELHIVHVDQQIPDKVFRLHTRRIYGLSVGVDGQIASVAPGESVKVWSPSEVAAEYTRLPGARLPPQAAASVWHPRSNVLGLVSEQQGTNMAATWSPGASQVDKVPLTGGVSSVHWIQSGDTLAVETTGGSWNAVTWPLSLSVAPIVTTQRTGPSYSSNGRFRVDGQFYSKKISIIDTHNKAATVHRQVKPLFAYAWHPHKPRLAVAEQNLIRLGDMDQEPSTWVSTPWSHQIQVTSSLAWSRDGKYLLAGSSSSAIHVLDGTTLEIVHALRGHAGAITVVAWSNDGTRIVSAGLDGFLRWWDAAKGIELFKIPIAKSDGIYELRFSADGRWLAGRTEAGQVHVWTTAGYVPPRPAPTPSPFVKLVGYDKVARPLAALNEAISLNPQAASAYYDRALWYIARQQWREALRDLEAYLKLQPDDSFWRGQALAICLLQADNDGRERHYKLLVEQLPTASTNDPRGVVLRSLSLDPHSSEESAALAKVLSELEQNKGEAQSPKPAWQHPKTLVQRFRIGTLYRAGRYAETIAATEEFLPNGPDKMYNALPWLFRIMALAQLKQTEQAESELMKLKAFVEEQTPYDTEEFDVYLFMTHAMHVRVLYREATQLILNKPDDLKIAELTIHEVSEETVEWLTAQINADSNNAQLWRERANLHHRWYRWGQAADDYQRYVHLNPNDNWHRQDLAITSLAAGREEDYLRHCRDLEAWLNALASPGTQHTRSARILSLRPGGFVDGEKLLAAAAKMAENSADWSLVHPPVLLLYRLGRYDEALREARRVELNRLNGDQLAPQHAWEALILWRLDRRPEARAALALAKRYFEDARRFRKDHHGHFRDYDLVVEAEIALREAEALVTAEDK